MAEQRFAASFRGVAFFVTDANDSAGQHTIIHEFPGRRPVVDHNGPTPQRFRLDCVLIGPNYQSELVALENALNTPGPGRLVHHWRGSFLVCVDGDYTVTRSTREGGMARLSISFVVAGNEDAPSVTVDTFDMVITEGDLARAAMINMVGDGFRAANNNAMAARAGNILTDIVTAVTDANASVQAQVNTVNAVGWQVSLFGRGSAGLINSPHTMASAISNVIGAVYGSILTIVDSSGEIDPLGDVRQVLSALLRGRQVLVALGLLSDGRRFGDNYATPAQNTPTQQQRADNQRLLVQAVKVSHVIESCAVISALGPDSRRVARQAFDEVADAVDELRGDVSDDLFRHLTDLRAAFGAHLRTQTARLPDLIEYTPTNTVPALLLAHTLYNDATRDDEIAERNVGVIEHPGFITGSVPIEVLSA